MQHLTPKEIREVCKAIVEGLDRDLGSAAVFDLLLAIDAHQGWYTEIVGSRGEAERMFLERCGAFDADLWEKVKATETWKKWRQHSATLSERYLALAIDEIVQGEVAE